MSGLHPTKIEWATHTWNPVTGCRHDCGYCYARAMAWRFQPKATERPAEGTKYTKTSGGCYVLREPAVQVDAGGYERVCQYPFGFAPTLYEYRLDFPEKCLTPGRIFVCSMADLFGWWVPDSWIEMVFEACKRAPRHKYLFLTKNPDRYTVLAEEGKLPTDSNFWYGSTMTGPRAKHFTSREHNTFLSIEPLLAPFGQTRFTGTQWLIVGAMTGPRAIRSRPKREWVEGIVETARSQGIPVFMKDSLVTVWGPELVTEFPEGMGVEAKADIPRCKDCESCVKVPQGKRGTAYYCGAEGVRHVLGRYTRTSPPWCPHREENQEGKDVGQD